MSKTNSFMLDCQLALYLNKGKEPNGILRKTGKAMVKHKLHKGTKCWTHVLGLVHHPKPYEILQNGILIHDQWLEQNEVL